MAGKSGKRKICVIITTRGNYAKMKSVIKGILARPDLQLQLILGGGVILEKYGRVLDMSEGADFPVDRHIPFLLEGETPVTMAKSAGIAVSEFSTAFEDLKPDVVIVIADRFESLAIAMAATYMNIPIVHVEGGEVSGSIDESIRHAITKMAHLHFPASEEAAQRIERMGEAPKTIFTVGATSLDVILELDLNDLSPVMAAQEVSGLGPPQALVPGEYLIVIQHPVTTEYADNLAHINETVEAIDALKRPTIWIWPNMDAGSNGVSKGIRVYREQRRPTHVHFFKSLPIELFAPLLKNAACIVGNSSSGIRESAFLGTPCVNVGTRQNGRDRGRNVVDVGYDAGAIRAAIEHQIAHGRYPADPIYGNGAAWQKMVEVLAEYQFTLQKQITY
ncbi:MAG: UDP-N-acetylglucosamine 2-epimerase (hydrolyzing) [Magnetococcales bacterium]|nr:UDP-N-acetylglucosamine 2-epimerase (hydrolyzing) [Magnetococcales bacterium]